MYVAACPPLTSLDDKDALVGRMVLTRIDGGWFGGKVVRSGASGKEKKEVPKATHAVEFSRAKEVPASLKVPSDMVGRKGAVLSTQTYGAAATWLLLEAAPAAKS